MKGILIIVLLVLNFSLKGQTITTFAGCGTSCPFGEGVPATAARIIDPNSGVFDKFGNFYFAQNQDHIISKVDTNGIITTVAGTTVAGYNGDSIAATAAELNFPSDVKVDTVGNLYICDHQNCRIRKVDISTGIINTIAGNGTPGFYGDGVPATNAEFLYPGYICFDSYGNLFVSDANNRRLRLVNTIGIITTYAGNGSPGYGGDGGPATAGEIAPGAICLDTYGNVYICDYSLGEARIAKVTRTTGFITTFAGKDTGYIYNGDGIPATSANIAPAAIAFDIYGSLFIADGANNRIRKIDATGIIHTVAGTGIASYGGDGGPATAAEFHQPESVTFDLCGSLYIADVGNVRVRKLNLPPAPTTPTISLSSPPTAVAGTTVTVTAAVANAGSSYTIHWLNHGIEFTTTTVPFVTYTKPPGIDTITARIVPAGYGCWDSTTSAGHVVSLPSGVSALSAAGGLIIYPNPVSNSLTITLYGALIEQATISNVLGQVVLSEAFNANKVELNVAALPAGLYFVKVNGVYVQKFIKQ